MSPKRPLTQRGVNWLLNRFSVPLNPANRIEELEKHKREVQSKIDEIEDEARRNSIAPGDIR